MITVGMNYKVVAGQDDLFVAVFEKILQVLQNMEGHAESHLYRDVFSPEEYVVVSEWNDEAAFDAFIASDRFRNVTKWGKENVLAGRPRHRVYGTTPDGSKDNSAPD